ncbi:hypothetical protein SO802_016109 [Lithocarpus litseifolius]|uniref:Uncharacterized protein n=1 Tax=Lithocarpus litseifolius TaxID=425828 RepID=A0AAW2CVJ2_9ROSI
MALICEAKGDYESALKHPVLAIMSMIANAQDNEVAAIDVSIDDCVSANLIRLYFPSLRIYAKPVLGALSEDISSGYRSVDGCDVLHDWDEQQDLNSFESDIAKLHSNGEKKSAFFGMVLNQLGLACMQLNLCMYCGIAEQPPDL